MAATQRSRGRRATGGLMEEVILIDGTLLNEVIIPTMNVDRRLPDGSRLGEEEIVNKSQIYVTTAGWKNSFAYDKLIMTLIEQITRPKGEALVAGGTWRIPVLAGLTQFLSVTLSMKLNSAATNTQDNPMAGSMKMMNIILKKI